MTLAATYLIVTGVVLALAGGACTLFQGAITAATYAPPNEAASFGYTLLLVATAVLVLGIFIIAAGLGSLEGRLWARWPGAFIAAVLAIVLCVLGAVALGTPDGTSAALVALLLGTAYAVSAWTFATSSAWFTARG